MTSELSKAYDPKDVEPRWYAYWLEHEVFAASDDPNDTRPVYVLPIPPPNVTGSLHMGHALTSTIEDVLVRYHRMRGFNTLWQPGIDHAGIATQTVVERLLKREGKSRHDLGREKFIERVWEWKAQSGGRISEQQRVLGVSVDWPRTKFTMDPDMCRAVREAFVRLYDEGLIYRDTRLIHWDCEAQTVLSNLEVENEPANGELFEFAYPVEGGEGEIVVATTRPETMLGDTAIAVHPDDPRYTHLHGKFVVHPFVDRRIPIVTDAVLVDMKFGTGAVKVTPAHDFNDFATGKRHKLEEITILNLDGTMNAAAGPFAGQDRFAARKAVKRALEEKGLARGAKPHQLMLPRSERNGSIVEPMISTQWFVKMAPLAEPALAAVREGKTKIIPEEWTKTYEHWMTNILDWCISRQLWWGHRIPAWHCAACGHVTVVNAEELATCAKCGVASPKQDDDVLDTWFSSGLWPFATLGWPDKTPALAKFYPASDLETGYDILFFWVARMMMMGIHFMGEPPFKRVLLHGLVVDETGDKMSKVKGNVIDPLDLIHGATFEQVVDKALPGAPQDEALKKFKKAYPSAASMGAGFTAYGADALRFTLATYSPQAKRIPLSPKKLEGNRNFCNKIWNATRYALGYLEGAKVDARAPKATLLPNRWILSRLSAVAAETHAHIDGFRLDDASLGLYHFFWGELCDWYLEISKPIFTAGGDHAAETRDVLAFVLEAALRLLHPFVPFITEELWHLVPRPDGEPRRGVPQTPPVGLDGEPRKGAPQTPPGGLDGEPRKGAPQTPPGGLDGEPRKGAPKGHGEADSIALAAYPTSEIAPRDASAERDMAILQAAIGAARSIRAEHELPRSDKLPMILRTSDAHVRELLTSQAGAIGFLINTAGPPVIEERGAERPKGAVMHMASDIEVLVQLKGLVEPAKETARVERELKKVEKDLAALQKKLSLPSFADKAPPEVVAEAHAQVGELQRKRAGLEEAKHIASELE